jgi:hypothetical protein
MKNRIILFLTAISLILSGPAFADTYFGYEEFGGTWHDVNRYWVVGEDMYLCWAGAASNTMAWAGWGIQEFYDTQEIYDSLLPACECPG